MAGQIHDVRETSWDDWVILHNEHNRISMAHLICHLTWLNSMPCLFSVHLRDLRNVSLFVVLSMVIHPIYLQSIWVQDRPGVTANQLLTLLVILTLSVIYMKAAERWLPSWWPGTHWNPMSSALSLRKSWGPSTASLVIPSIQWLITPMYSTWFGLVQRSTVSEMRPRAP